MPRHHPEPEPLVPYMACDRHKLIELGQWLLYECQEPTAWRAPMVLAVERALAALPAFESADAEAAR